LKIKNSNIEDVFLIVPEIHTDSRGYFFEVMKDSFLGMKFVQINQSMSKKNVIRGLHFQKFPYAMDKLVRCIQGKILDIAVDIRPKSKTYKKYIKQILDSEKNEMMFIPRGFAHGFLVISDFAIVEYQCTEEYNKKYDSGIIWNDLDIKIKWNLENPILSEKDKNLQTLKDYENENK